MPNTNMEELGKDSTIDLFFQRAIVQRGGQDIGLQRGVSLKQKQGKLQLLALQVSF